MFPCSTAVVDYPSRNSVRGLAAFDGCPRPSTADQKAKPMRLFSKKAVPRARGQFSNPADASEYFNALEADEAVVQALRLEPEQLIELLEQPEFRYARNVVVKLVNDGLAKVLVNLAEDRLADILGAIDASARESALGQLPAPTRDSVIRLLRYPPHTAGGLMTTEFVSVPDTATVEQVLRHVREVERSRETIYAIYALDQRSVLNFVISLRQLVSAEPDAPIVTLRLSPVPITVQTLDTQDDVARLIRRHDLLALPVVDDEGHVLGIVTVDDVIDAMMDSATEDMQRFGGSARLTEPYLDISFLTMIRKRAGWLAVLFIGELLTASAMQHYELELEKAVVLAMFIPLIMSSGGNSGSQSTSLLIRGLALGDVTLSDWWRVALRELPTGLTLGVMLGSMGFSRIMAWQMLGLYDYGPHSILIASTVGAALVGIVAFGSMAGAMLPFALQRLGFDPASASAPFVATLVDVSGLIIYFSIASVILGGALL